MRPKIVIPICSTIGRVSFIKVEKSQWEFGATNINYILLVLQQVIWYLPSYTWEMCTWLVCYFNEIAMCNAGARVTHCKGFWIDMNWANRMGITILFSSTKFKEIKK